MAWTGPVRVRGHHHCTALGSVGSPTIRATAKAEDVAEEDAHVEERLSLSLFLHKLFSCFASSSLPRQPSQIAAAAAASVKDERADVKTRTILFHDARNRARL